MPVCTISIDPKAFDEDIRILTDAHGGATKPRYVPSKKSMLALKRPSLIYRIEK